MKRREFLQVSAMATGMAATSALAQSESDGAAPEYYEWRSYSVPDAEKQAAVLRYLETAAVPAWKRMGLGPVGVFTETGENAGNTVHVLIVYKGLDAFAKARTALEHDQEYLESAADYLAATMQDPAFERIESSLMVAFAGQPQLSIPEHKERVFEMREYQSHSESKARRKIEMFNSGEIPIFRKVGFETVFFGETLSGPRLPNLKYMLCAESLEACKANFDKFRVHPDWAAMKDLPQYAETVSGVVQKFLVPAAFSQI